MFNFESVTRDLEKESGLIFSWISLLAKLQMKDLR